MKRADEFIEVPQAPEPEIVNLPSGQRATTKATLQVGATGGSIADIETLRQTYEVNGKSAEFDAQKMLWDFQKGADAKQSLYDKMQRRAAMLPNQPAPEMDFTDPEQADVLANHIANYQRTDHLPEFDLFVRNSLAASMPSKDTINPHEYSIQREMLQEPQRLAAELIAQEKEIEVERRSIGATMDLPSWKQTAQNFLNVYRMFVPGHDEFLVKELLKAEGTETGYKEWIAGEGYQALREAITNAPHPVKLQMLRQIRKEIEDHPNWYPDIVQMDIIGSIYTDDVLINNNPDMGLDRLFRNIGTFANVQQIFELAGKSLSFSKLLFRNGAISAVNKVSRKGSQRLLANLLAEFDQSATLNRWGTTSSQVALSQLPTPAAAKAVNLPDGVPQAAEHIAMVREDINEVLKNSREDLFTNKEVIGAVEREASKLETDLGGRLRLGRSSIQVFDDRSGVRFGSVIGSSDTHGFSDFESARLYAASLDGSLKNVKVLEVDPHQNLVPLASGEALKPGAHGNKAGEFYVKYDQDYFFRPEDKLLFGDDPVVSPSWLGRAALWFETPSAIFSPEVYNKFTRAYLTEQALVGNMDRLVAPVFKELSIAERQGVGKMWEWTEQFGRREKKVPTWTQLREAFPNVTDKELTGWYYMRQYYDTVYHINNHRLYQSFASDGYKSLSAGGTSYHGKPMQLDDMWKFRDPDSKNFVVFDPVQNIEVALTKPQLKKLYEDGGSVLELPIPMSAGPGGKLTTLVAHVPNTGSTLGALSKFPLQYTPGYYPRLYKDSIFVKKTTQGVSINGRTTTHTTTVATSPDRRSATDFVERLNRERGDDATTYHIEEDDPRLGDKDRTARDLQQMQIEGRIFFDARNADPLASSLGGRAEIVDPINAMERTGRMLSRQVATEDLVRTMKTQFIEKWGHLIPSDPTKMTSSSIQAELEAVVKSSNGPVAKDAAQAHALWQYIRVMEGSLYGGGTEFRRMAVRAAEFLQNNILPKGSKVGTLIARNAEKFSPVEWMKSLAFFDFMTTRPLRQLILQGSQHIFLQGLDPKYAGKWQMDSFLLMSGARGRNLELAGLKNESKLLRTRNAKMMGVSLKEYDLIVTKFNQSGLAQAVNMHTFASDVMMTPKETPMTKAGQIGQAVAGVATARPIRQAANKYGFQAGEGFNVAASYMMAIRRIMVENKYKTVSQLTDEDWAAATSRGSNYALAMHRANASHYQYGLLSLPMQFLSFTHKVALTFLQAAPDWTQVGKLGNKAFTKSEARKILAGQFLLFGAAGFGMKPEAEKALTDLGMDKYAGGIVADLIAGGFLDMVLDAALQKAVDDPDLDLPFDEFLAPGANFINVMRNFWEAGTQKTLVETALGPSAQTTGRLIEAAKIGHDMTVIDFPEWTPAEELGITLEAALSGAASGYNDYLKARLAWKTGELLSQSGVPAKYNATREEALAKGMFGVTSTGQKELWALTMDIKDRMKALDEVAKEYHTRLLNLTTKFANEDSYSMEYYRNQIALERALLNGLPPEERTYVMQQFNALEAARKTSGDDIGGRVAQALAKNAPTPAEWLIYRINKSPAIEPADKGPLTEMIRRHDEQLKNAGEMWDQHLQNSDAVIQTRPRTGEPVPKEVKPKAAPPPSAGLTDADRKRLRDRALASSSLKEKADIARQLGASEQEVQAILAKAPRSKS